MSGDPPAGWYPDPNDSEASRYWNGSSWTAHTGTRDGMEGRPAPPSAQPGDPAAPAAERETPKPLHPVAWWAYGVLAFSVLVNVGYTVVALMYAGKVQTQIDTGSVTLQQAEDIEHALSICSVVWLISLAGGAVGFLVWWSRAYRNLPGITGRSLRFGRGWAIGAWFVPILSLWRPKQIGNDIWRGGDAQAPGNAAWTSLPVSQLVNWWWAIYLLSSFIGGVAGGLLSGDPVLSNSVTSPDLIPVANPPSHADLVQEHSAAITLAISNVIDIGSAVLAVLFVKGATERQDRTIAEVERAEATT